MESAINTLTPAQLCTLVPLHSLMPAHQQELLQHSEIVYACAGDVLLEPGQFDRVCYYLLSGELMLEYPRGARELLKSRTSLSPVAPAQPRNCRAVAHSDITLLTIPADRLEQLLTWSQAAEHLLVDLATRRELDEDAVWLDTVLRSNLFLKVPPTNVGQILRHLQTRLVTAGEVIIRQGERGDCCYFIKEGVAEVTRNPVASVAGRVAQPIHLADISAGRCFGEDALIQETVRNANVMMKTDGVLLVLDKQDFLPLLKEPEIPWLTFDEVRQLAPAPILLDVRTEAEYSQWHLHSAVNLPLHLLHLKRRVLDLAHTYITCCNSAARAGAACHFLQQMGYRVYGLRQGLDSLDDAVKTPLWSEQDFILKGGQVICGH